MAVGATCWMLQGWLPQRWAFLGGLLAATHPGIQFVWGTRYWGGAVAMLAGAIVMGALPRIHGTGRGIYSALLGSGIILLAITRPYEGLVLSGIVVLYLVVVPGNATDRAQRISSTGFPLIAALLVGFGIMGYHNYRVTGNPTTLPYQVHERAYGRTPLFVFGSPREGLVFRHETMQRFQDIHYQGFRRLEGGANGLGDKLRWFWRFGRKFLGPQILLLCLCSLCAGRSRFAWFCWTVVSAAVAAQMITVWTWAHYIAPILPALFGLAICGLRALNRSCRHNSICRATLLLLILCFHSVIAVQGADRYRNRPVWQNALKRGSLLDRLRDTDEKHLVIVRYSKDHDPNQEYVYNAADIDNADIVWAREMDDRQNDRLLDYFSDRRAWLFLPDKKGVVLLPYSKSAD
ncbi:MAG: hypothetical protein MI757_04845 [Pirellulales bacterium]|nr:hypothetical protein [Pirellulales bacterium]